jgi:hypothetical protein
MAERTFLTSPELRISPAAWAREAVSSADGPADDGCTPTAALRLGAFRALGLAFLARVFLLVHGRAAFAAPVA